MIDRQPKEGGMTEKQLQDFLDKGGKIQYCPPNTRTDIDYKTSFYGKKKKKEADKE
jgi:hypothetical protein